MAKGDTSGYNAAPGGNDARRAGPNSGSRRYAAIGCGADSDTTRAGGRDAAR